VVTGTRAEFGLLRLLIQEIEKSEDLELQIIATGMHLSPEFGDTYKEIEESGFRIDAKVEMLLSSDTSVSVTKSMGIGLIGFADAFRILSPDLVILLGDRYEIFTAATAAMIACIPIAHIHGGETTEGAFDEAIRHSITKMSHLHFVAAEEYRRRVIQLGEQPERVFLVGGLGIDAIQNVKILGREELEESIGFKFGKKSLLITFHPVTLEGNSSISQMNILLAALDELYDTNIIFTMPNADTGSHELTELIKLYAESRPNVCVFKSLGQQRYLSCMKYVDGVVGNSSSGLLEAPYMQIGTIDIGDRQKGRLAADSVIRCKSELNSIRKALKNLYNQKYRATLINTINPYGNGGASKKIVDVIRKHPLDGLLKKSFNDLPSNTI
jgi:GDP/UDP-N,N'-diacetylbacillosamine 2-epimerase (hydrolysing)